MINYRIPFTEFSHLINPPQLMADDSTYGVLVSFVVTWPVASLIISTTVVAFRTKVKEYHQRYDQVHTQSYHPSPW